MNRTQILINSPLLWLLGLVPASRCRRGPRGRSMKPLSQVLLLGNGFQRLMDGFSAGLPEEQNLYLDINLPLRDRHACLGRTKPSKLLSEGSWPSPEPLEAAMAGARVMTCEIQPYSSSPARLHRRRRLRPRSQPAADLSWCRRLCVSSCGLTGGVRMGSWGGG